MCIGVYLYKRALTKPAGGGGGGGSVAISESNFSRKDPTMVQPSSAKGGAKGGGVGGEAA